MSLLLKQMLGEEAHRPWPMPRSPWMMFQRWESLLFAHWPLPADILRPLIPASLEVDTFDGQGWIGVVPFTMHFSLRGLPFHKVLFHELNVRTYVTPNNAHQENKPGVYFFSLDATSLFSVISAKTLFNLPYYHADIRFNKKSQQIEYESLRRQTPLGGEAAFSGSYGPTGPVMTAEKGSLEHWLTERYRLYTVNNPGQLMHVDIHHAPWPLQPAEASISKNTMAQVQGIHLPEISPILHYAEQLDVVSWPLTRTR